MIPQRLIYKKGLLYILDQRLIPFKIFYFKAKKVEDVYIAIKDMMVRGAPLIGDAAAYGYLLGIDNIIKKRITRKSEVIKILEKNSQKLKSSRPTAVSLFKCTDRIHKKAIDYLKIFKGSFLTINELEKLREIVHCEVSSIVDEDINSTLAIAKNGISLLKKGSSIITYCNTGALATAGVGTALGIISQGYKKGFIKYVYACETRPYLQGARLTSWELLNNKIPSSLICDNMAGWVMKTKKIDAVIIGADRIAANGDTANKIGSYSLAILSSYHKIPFYVAAPTDTFDLSINSGKDIVIEEREGKEVIKINNNYITDPKVSATHFAFDIVPANLITAIITEKGIITKPNKKKIFLHLYQYINK